MPLPALLGATLEQTAAALGVCRASVPRLQAAFRLKKTPNSQPPPTRGGRRRREVKTALVDAARYVGHNLGRMDYAVNQAMNLPIGSGVIEAACKHVVKQRVACSGMKWKRKGLQAVLTLRSLYQSTGRWEQFWGKVQILGW